MLLQACVASTGVAVACRCVVRRWISGCSVRCCKLSQLSHGGATSSNDGRAVIIRNGRVSAGMVANALRFTVCSCKIACDVGSAWSRWLRQRKDPSLARIRPNTDLCDACQDPSGEPTSGRRPLSPAAPPKRGQPSARRRRRRPHHARRTDHYEPPGYRDGQPQRRLSCSATQTRAASQTQQS